MSSTVNRTRSLSVEQVGRFLTRFITFEASTTIGLVRFC